MLNDAIKDLNMANHSFTKINERIKWHLQGIDTSFQSCRLEFIKISHEEQNNTVTFTFFDRTIILFAKITDSSSAAFTIFSKNHDLSEEFPEYTELGEFSMNKQGVILGQETDDNIGYLLIPIIRDYILGINRE